MNILVPDISIAEKVLRAPVAYTFLVVAFRLCAQPCATTVSSLRHIHDAFLEEDGHVSGVTRRPAGG